MFVSGGYAARVGQEACGKARQDKRKAPYCWATGYNGRAYRKTSAYLCSAILKKPEHTEERK